MDAYTPRIPQAADPQSLRHQLLRHYSRSSHSLITSPGQCQSNSTPLIKPRPTTTHPHIPSITVNTLSHEHKSMSSTFMSASRIGGVVLAQSTQVVVTVRSHRSQWPLQPVRRPTTGLRMRLRRRPSPPRRYPDHHSLRQARTTSATNYLLFHRQLHPIPN